MGTIPQTDNGDFPRVSDIHRLSPGPGVASKKVHRDDGVADIAEGACL